MEVLPGILEQEEVIILLHHYPLTGGMDLSERLVLLKIQISTPLSSAMLWKQRRFLLQGGRIPV